MRTERSYWIGIHVIGASMACALASAPAAGQTFGLRGGDIDRRADAVLTLMGYTLTPDVTTGSLSISNEPTGNPDIGITSLGGGFTLSRDFPLYLEGTAAYSRYDPTFVASNGTTERSIPAKWNSISATGGVGWDFPVAKELVFRPIFNFMLGHVESDASLAQRFVGARTGSDVDFLEGGQLDVYGLGGSLMLDYERYRPENEIDVELRYTNIYMETFNATETSAEGSSDSQTIGLWSRWRAPTGLTLLDRPLRYVVEYAYTSFLGDLDGVLGFDHLNSIGGGLELDSSAYDIVITRTRLVARYKFGENVSGWSIGLAVSF